MKKTDLIGLRVGNLVYDAASQSNIKVEESHLIDVQNLEPILITPELLEKIGFEKRLKNETKYPIQNNQLYFILSSRDNYKWENVDKKFPGIRYIHQLQNVYFALTETELL